MVGAMLRSIGLLVLLFGSSAGAQPAPAPAPSDAKPAVASAPVEDGEKRKPDDAKPSPVVTKGEVTVGGEVVRYGATTGCMTLKEEQGKERASVFYVAYVKEGVQDPGTRPVTFVFNGGPGSSSVWLHMGALGPRRVVMGDAGALLPPPYRYTDNEFSWLGATDLVFIDPVGTGFSRPAEGREQKEFSGLQNDLDSVAEFIRLYVTKEGRWLSPKFLAGESYGTTRAAGLSGLLQDRHGMTLNGLVLISAILNFQTARFDTGNDLPYALYAPAYAATAHYHKALAPELQARPLADLMREVEKWSLEVYLPALAQGALLGEQREREIAARLAAYTGLSEEFVRQANLRVSLGRFSKELLRDRRLTVGRLDSRFTGIDADAAGESYGEDPSYSAILGPYTAALNDYVRRVLKFESDLPYEILTGRVRPWSYAQHENRYVNVAETLRAAMTKNPALKVLVMEGLYDLATPSFAADYTIAQLGLEPHLRGNISAKRYEAGHMMYVHEPSLAQTHRDAVEFIRAASGTAGR